MRPGHQLCLPGEWKLFIWQIRTVVADRRLMLRGATWLQLCSGLQLIPSVYMFSLVHFVNSDGQGIVQGPVYEVPEDTWCCWPRNKNTQGKNQTRLPTRCYFIRFCSLCWTWREPKRKILKHSQTSWGSFCICFPNFLPTSSLALIICHRLFCLSLITSRCC